MLMYNEKYVNYIITGFATSNTYNYWLLYVNWCLFYQWKCPVFDGTTRCTQEIWSGGETVAAQFPGYILIASQTLFASCHNVTYYGYTILLWGHICTAHLRKFHAHVWRLVQCNVRSLVGKTSWVLPAYRGRRQQQKQDMCTLRNRVKVINFLASTCCTLYCMWLYMW